MSDTERADDLAKFLVSNNTTVTENTSQEMIVVTRDKVELALRRNLPRYVTAEQVFTSGGLLLALGTTIVTADFQAALGVDADTWRGIFVAATLGSLALFGRDLARVLRRPGLEKLVDSIASDSRPTPSD
jgi:hypothetical protein